MANGYHTSLQLPPAPLALLSDRKIYKEEGLLVTGGEWRQMSIEIWRSKWILILDSGERGIIRLKKREYRTLGKNNDKSRVLYPLFMFS